MEKVEKCCTNKNTNDINEIPKPVQEVVVPDCIAQIPKPPIGELKKKISFLDFHLPTQNLKLPKFNLNNC